MSDDPIEGVDYIFDRYAYLGLDTGASAETVSKTIQQLRRQVHPDAMRGVHPDIVKKSDAIRALVDSCAVILENEALRPLYTERLLEFRRDKPEMVSASGIPKESLQHERVNLDFLLQGQSVAIDALKEHIQQLSGYSPKQVAAAKKFYAADPSEENREFLQSVLNRKFIYFTIFEETAWQNAGIGNIKMDLGYMLDPQDYASRVEQEIETRHAGFAEAMQTRNNALLIGVAKPLYLLGDGAGNVTEPPRGEGMSIEIQQKLTERVQQAFLERADLIRKVAEEKQQALSELVQVTLVRDLGIPVETRKPYNLYVMKPGENEGDEPRAVFSLPVTDKAKIQFVRNENCAGMTYSQLCQLGEQGCAVYRNPEVPSFMLEVGFAAEKYCNTYLPEIPSPSERTPAKNGVTETSRLQT